ncbi:hypothetical protein GGR54DRAFT_643886 [Hypoxylon sp. NC1633]|nr:hypothetical protein GGR54DRAFT_643886 [Hypoxylon sp. NC1633]
MWLPDLAKSNTLNEDVLVLSSAFSVVASVLLESLLFFVLRNKSNPTQSWIKCTIYTILLANAVLALTAFIFASVHRSPSDDDFVCGVRVASRWLSLLISIFSVMLLVSAWLDFREQDKWQAEILRLEEESFDEKRPTYQIVAR